MYAISVFVVVAFFILRMIHHASGVLKSHDGLNLSGRIDGLWLLLALAAMTMTVAPGMSTYALLLTTESSGAVALGGSGVLPVAASMLGALVCVAWSFVELRSRGRDGPKAGFVFGLPALAGAHLLIAGAMHLAFALPGSGMANLDALRAEVRDVNCSSPVIIVQWDGRRREDPASATFRPVRYRCPTGMVLNPATQTPFLPWPEYTEGESRDLARFLAPALGGR